MDAPRPGGVNDPPGPDDGADAAGVQDPLDPSVRELKVILGDARTIAVSNPNNGCSSASITGLFARPSVAPW